MSISSSSANKMAGLGAIDVTLPTPVNNAIEKWASKSLNDKIGNWKSDYASHIIPSESYIDSIQSAHISTLSTLYPFTLHVSLKHVLKVLVQFCSDLMTWSPSGTDFNPMVQALFPFVFDVTTEFLADKVWPSLESILGVAGGNNFKEKMYEYVMEKCYNLICNHSTSESNLDESTFNDCLRFIEVHLEKPAGKVAIEKFFTSGKGDLVTVLLSAAQDNLGPMYGTKVLKVFNKLFYLAEMHPKDNSYEALCKSLGQLSHVDTSVLQAWLSKMLTNTVQTSATSTSKQDSGNSKSHENRLLLQSLTKYIVKSNSHMNEDVCSAILSALLPMGLDLLTSSTTDAVVFTELMVVMTTLAGSGSGQGHVQLFKAALKWMNMCQVYLSEKKLIEKLEEGLTGGKNQMMLQSACHLMSYIGNVLSALKVSSDHPTVATGPAVSAECRGAGTSDLSATGMPTLVMDVDHDWVEDIHIDDDDDGLEDSDDESLNNKLCTYSVTQKEFINQHWYHCHTCKMVDGVGVCTVCAKVCHQDHDLSYAKYGSFFCDCGAKEDGSCIAMTKRSVQSGLDSSIRNQPTPPSSSGAPSSNSSPYPMALASGMSLGGSAMIHSILGHALHSRGESIATAKSSSSTPERQVIKADNKAREVMCKQLQNYESALLTTLSQHDTSDSVLSLIESLLPVVTTNSQQLSPLGCSTRAREALHQLHTQTKKVESTESLMSATLGSQEGAFENVRMNYSGEQGQTIRQLVNSHVLRRVAMCCLASPQGKRQHLAVSHEKGKITILQLSALLRQADSSKRKLTLTRLASAPIPFTVLSVTGNPCNEDFLAVCGLKECHILTFTGLGTVSDHLVLHPALETGNFIIRAVWLPGSQTQIAVVTADFVKIYDLSTDAISPQYFFLLPSSKIRDCTFVVTPDGGSGSTDRDNGSDDQGTSGQSVTLALMSASGYIYTQTMDDASHAKHGPFYITTIVDIQHPDITESGGQVAGGGVSIYYSHVLQLMFFSYSQGKSFAAPINKDLDELSMLFPITMKSKSSSPLVGWMEVANHPGLICAMTQSNNTPVILMIAPETIHVQEVKIQPAKAKIQDMVAIRHCATNSDQQRTTLILLCEDGSLRIYMANIDATNYWMTPNLLPPNALSVLKPVKKKKSTRTGRPAGQVTFPVDFFEHCQHSNEVDFTGKDILQVYNVAQVKHRLSTIGMYIACTKPSGFNIEINNNNNSNVMCGLRVFVGGQTFDRAPSTLEVFRHTVQVNLTRARWYDLPFTRQESLTADKKVVLTVGASADPATVTMIDSIKVYVKSKSAFNWPEDDDLPDNSAGSNQPSSQPPTTKESSVATTTTTSVIDSTDSIDNVPLTQFGSKQSSTAACVDRLMSSSLEVLNGIFVLSTEMETQQKNKSCAMNLATQLLTLPPMTNAVMNNTKSLLSSLHSSKHDYHHHKDHAQLTSVARGMFNGPDIDPEAFQRLIVTARSIAISRPENLVQYANTEYANQYAATITSAPTDSDTPYVQTSSGAAQAYSFIRLTEAEQLHFTTHLVQTFWRLHANRPSNVQIAPACLPGLTQVESTVMVLVEIIHAFTLIDPEYVNLAVKLYILLLLSEDSVISFACKQAMIRVLRPRQKQKKSYTPPRSCASGGGTELEDEDEDKSTPVPPLNVTPPSGGSGQDQGSSTPQEQHEIQANGGEGYQILEPSDLENIVLMPSGGQNPLQALLHAGLPQGFSDAIPAVLQSNMMNSLPGALQQNLPAALQGAFVPGGQPAHPDLPEGLMPDDISPEAQDGLAEGLGESGLPSMLDIPSDADDETMSGEAGGLNLQALNLGRQSQAPVSVSVDTEHLSDTTASAPGSDEENASSNAAQENTPSASLPVSMEDVSGVFDGQDTATCIVEDAGPSGSQEGLATTDGGGSVQDKQISKELHVLRLTLLQHFTQYVQHLSVVGGLRSIPFMQVLLMLTSDIDNEEDIDKSALDQLLTTLLSELNMKEQDITNMSCRSYKYEVHLIIMRLLSVLMSQVKTSAKSEAASFVSISTAAALLQSGGLEYCLALLENLLEHWKKLSPEQDSGPLSGQLLKAHSGTAVPDMSPFFQRQYVRSNVHDVFAPYTQLLTEMLLRLPYQMKKIADSDSVAQSSVLTTAVLVSAPPPVFAENWFQCLCEYMLTPYVRRQVRKLLMFISGSKDRYRQLRDMHALQTNMKQVEILCKQAGVNHERKTANPLPYDSLITMIEHLKTCADIASSRTSNWQTYCQKQQDTILLLFDASIILDEGVASVLLQLLQCALCQPANQGSKDKKSEKENTKETKKENTQETAHLETAVVDVGTLELSMNYQLVQHISGVISDETLSKFIRRFLLESNATAVRWQAHSLVHHIYRYSNVTQQMSLLALLWGLWPELAMYGHKAAQFVDLLGYFTLKTPDCAERKSKHVEQAVLMLHKQNHLLATHPNGAVYSMLQGLVDFDGFYLESDPCLVCNNPEVNYANTKLSAIKVDSKFTTNTQIVKLVSSQNISKVVIRISDLKRSKMVRTIKIYYNNRSVQAVVELKNKPGLWHQAKKMVLQSGQTEVKIDFPLPIIACNLMIEYCDFYDNLQASAETLQCPRCSASVPANPGVCGNCGENVFQCHKCRAINYDEKDPFLCNACGFCKYAKFDFTLTAKPCCAVDPIESDENRKKAVASVNTLLEKADRLYKQLQLNRPALEDLLIKITEKGLDKIQESSSSNTGTSAVNKAIHHLAQRYCVDCRNAFEELSKIIQAVLATRKELQEYDRQQCQVSANLTSPIATPIATPITTPSVVAPGTLGTAHPLAMSNQMVEQNVAAQAKPREKLSQCYGCASATVEHCITLIRAMATNASMKQILCKQGLLSKLLDYNLRRNSVTMRTEVRSLLCLLAKDNEPATEQLCTMLYQRITTAILNHLATPDFAASVRHEMLLLSAMIHTEDTCMETKVRSVLRLFLLGVRVESPAVCEYVAHPCLRILQHIIQPQAPTSKRNKDKTADSLASVKSGQVALHADLNGWLKGNKTADIQQWKRNMIAKPIDIVSKKPKKDDASKPASKDMVKRVTRVKYLMEHYGYKWLNKAQKSKTHDISLVTDSWLCSVMFSPSSRSIRQTACTMIEVICQSHERKQKMLDLLTTYLSELGSAGESAAQFLALYKRLISTGHWKYYLALKGIITDIGNLITKEIQELSLLEECTLNSDLCQGYALKALTELLVLLLEPTTLKRQYKSHLLSTVLNGYLSLKHLVIQRTTLIDETQDILLQLLEDITTGTEAETLEFMAVCVHTVHRYPITDLRSPVFIFERLCSIIYPEENDVVEFLLSLEKDPQQEDFLQGHMVGNPYNATEPGLGPLMRDVKNKICQDCELVALLEDDTGMELLVNNKIISLDLAVKDVYKKIWMSEHGDVEPMRVVYRMRGLLGDATEDMVNSLDTKSDDDVDNEMVYRMAGVMSECNGLQVMLHRLAGIHDLVSGKQLLVVLLKLFSYCLKLKKNRQLLLKPEMNTITIMLQALNLALLAEQESVVTGKGQTLTEQILQLMEMVLMEATSMPPSQYKEFSTLCGDSGQLTMLLDRINSPFVRANNSVLQALMRLIPFLAFDDPTKMQTLITHFQSYLHYNKYDAEHTQDEQVHLDCFCVIANAIEPNTNGQRLKDLIVDNNIVSDALDYIKSHAPTFKTLLNTDKERWKEFISKPSLSYVLRLLTGLCNSHPKTQMLFGEDVIAVLHKLEQVSSDQHVGTASENLMEALRQNQTSKIEDIRRQTRAEKKKLAMAKRQKQLGALGMTTNERGQVTVQGSLMKQIEQLKDETGLSCCICREGYKNQPTKVLGIYTFSKRVNLDVAELKQRKTQGYSTVSHFNVIHIDCHLSAVRHARVRDEWESAALQNANTKCNGLLPLWGPQVPESAYASCLARHNTYLQECTGIRDVSYSLTVHDIKHLLLNFAHERSLSTDSGGGSRQSNVHLLPYIVHLVLYVLNTTRGIAREEKNLMAYLKQTKEKWIQSAYEIEGATYWCTMSIHIYDHKTWREHRRSLLNRLLMQAHIRHLNTQPSNSVSDKSVQAYSVYKPYLLFYGFIDGLHTILFKNVSVPGGSSWSQSLAEYIRNNDQTMITQSDALVAFYEQKLLVTETMQQYAEATGLIKELPNPDDYMKQLFTGLP